MSVAKDPVATSKFLDTAFRTVLLPSRQEWTWRLGIGGAVLFVAEASLVAFSRTIEAFALTIPLLGILVASWYGGFAAGLFGIALTCVLSLALGRNEPTDLFRLATLVTTAVLGCLLLELLRRSVNVAVRLAEERTAEADRANFAQGQIKLIADSAMVFLFESSADGSTLWESDAFYDYTGLARKDVAGEHWPPARVVHPDDLPAVIELRDKAVATREPFEVEVRMRRADGEYRWFLTRMTPHFDETGRLRAWTGSSTDVDTLRRTEDMLREANREKDEFVSLVAHELRGPILMIVGNAAALETGFETLAPETRRQALNDIAESAERLDRTVTELLAVGRIEGGSHPETEPMLLRRLVAKLAAEHRKQFPTRELKVTLSGDSAPVLGNELLLLLIMRNLLNNAEKYSPAEQPIEITVERLSDDVRFNVRDHGSGLPVEQQKRVFEPFYRSTASMPADGFGVGLAVCRRLVEALHGRIWVRNHEEGGAVFSFELPIASAEEDY